MKNGELDTSGEWKLGYKEQFHELADVTSLWFEGKWYLYPSVDMAWVSADNGASWQHHPLNVRDIGYAPTVVRHRGRFLLLASGSPLYTSDAPTPQRRNPILRTTEGLITGPAHGCVVAGPEDELWAFYTIRAGVVHPFERRLGMDRVEIEANGELAVRGATSLPQWLAGNIPANGTSGDTGWLPLNGEVRTVGSTTANNLQARFAVDNDMRTWWQPAEGDVQPILTCTFMAPATAHAVRLIWRDVGLDTNRGVMPGPFRYRVELETEKDKWMTILDRSNSTEDLLIDYRECKPTVGTRAACDSRLAQGYHSRCRRVHRFWQDTSGQLTPGERMLVTVGSRRTIWRTMRRLRGRICE